MGVDTTENPRSISARVGSIQRNQTTKISWQSHLRYLQSSNLSWQRKVDLMQTTHNTLFVVCGRDVGCWFLVTVLRNSGLTISEMREDQQQTLDH